MDLPHRTPALRRGRRQFLVAGATALGGAAFSVVAPTASADDRPEHVIVTSFGAAGDGVTDDTEAIAAADAAARSQGSALYFPQGTYRGFGFRPTTSWRGGGDAVLMSNRRVRAAETTLFLRVEGAAGLVFSGLVFDGWVTEDPPAWSADTMHAFFGAVPFVLAGSRDVVLQDCTFRNAYQAPLRIEGCSDVVVDRCRMLRARNPWGDGTYVTGSQRVTYRDCHVEDYTRIGFVCDATAEGTSDVTYLRCTATGGHDASILYGGGEYNAGFWTENSTRTTYRACTAGHNTHFGFVLASGPQGTSGHLAENCSATFSPVGFKASSWGARPTNVELNGCSAQPAAGRSGAPASSFLFTPRYSTDSLTVRNVTSVIGPRVTDSAAVHLRVEALAPDVAAQVAFRDATLVCPRDTAAAEVRVSGPFVGNVRVDGVRAVPRQQVRIVVDPPASPRLTVSRTPVQAGGR